MNTALGRTNVAILTNKSGGDLTQGAVVVISGGTAKAFTTTTTVGFYNGFVGVILEPAGIANNATGLVAFSGWVPKINLSGAASLGDLFKTHSVAGQAVRHASPAVSGDFGMVLETGTTPSAILFGLPNPPAAAGNIATDAIWDAAGDLAVGSGSDAAVRLPIGTAGRVLVSDPTGALAYVGGMQLISESVLAVAAGDITFSSIPNTFRHLKIFLNTRGDVASTNTNLQVQLNSDTGNNYDDQWMYASATTPAAAEAHAAAFMRLSNFPAANATANYAAVIELTFINYKGTAFNKMVTSISADMRSTASGDLAVRQLGGVWRNTAAITAIKLFPAAGNFLAGTVASLYGLSS